MAGIGRRLRCGCNVGRRCARPGARRPRPTWRTQLRVDQRSPPPSTAAPHVARCDTLLSMRAWLTAAGLVAGLLLVGGCDRQLAPEPLSSYCPTCPTLAQARAAVCSPPVAAWHRGWSPRFGAESKCGEWTALVLSDDADPMGGTNFYFDSAGVLVTANLQNQRGGRWTEYGQAVPCAPWTQWTIHRCGAQGQLVSTPPTSP
jgi:hypothetical protein